ncbi:MAG: von Willebrand factor type A domain-containing protein, partial [Caulobacteraceae bacterium]
MARGRRTLALVLLPALAAGGASPASFAAAQQVRSQQVRDGEPTAQACSAYGYDLREGRSEDRRGRPLPMAPPPSQRSGNLSQVQPPPAITLPAPNQEAMAAGAKRAQDSFGGRYAPPPRWPSTERYPQAATNTVKRVAEAPVSTFSIDVDTASYANVRRFLNDGQAPPKDAVRVEELVNYFDYGYPQPQSRAQPFQTFVAVAPSPWARGKQVVHIGLQGYTLPKANRPPVNLTFL